MNAITINHPDLGNNKLIIKTSLLGLSKLFYNNIQIQRVKRVYSLSQQIGKPFELKMRDKIYDNIPEIKINGNEFEISSPLKWHEYVWMGLPILLIFAGGAIGAFLGIIAVKVNSSIFRSGKSGFQKHAITLGINLLIALVFFVVAAAIQLAVNPE